jgi:hypothetical protein
LAENQIRAKKKKSAEDFLTLESRANFLSSKIRSLSNSLPLQMGARVSNVDQKVMIALIAQYYGNPKYLQIFEEKSMPISLASLDTIMLDPFQQQSGRKTNERRGETAEEKKATRIEKDSHPHHSATPHHSSIVLTNTRLTICQST